MKRNNVIILLALLVTSLACGLLSGNRGSSEEVVPSGGDDVTEESPTLSESGDDSNTNNAEFPLPSDVENFMDLGNSGINYQTSLSLTEVVDFYRDAFGNAGYVERDITTVVNDTTFSIVWDGHPSGQAIVVQGVDLGNGTVNVNVRFENV